MAPAPQSSKPSTPQPAASQPLPYGYEWATDGALKESESPKPSSPVPIDAPRLKPNSSLVFDMIKPQDWAQLSLEAKFQRKRGNQLTTKIQLDIELTLASEYLCEQWGEKNFTFFEDIYCLRNDRGRIKVRDHDYFAHFEVWNAEHFEVQYHNSMTLLQEGLKMDDDDFARLQRSLGIVDAEFLDAFNDWESHFGQLEAQIAAQPPKAPVMSHVTATTKRPPAPATKPKNLSKQNLKSRKATFGNGESLAVKAPLKPAQETRAALEYPHTLTSTRPAAQTAHPSLNRRQDQLTAHTPSVPQKKLEAHKSFIHPHVGPAAQSVSHPISRDPADVVKKHHLADVTSSRGNRILGNSNNTQKAQPQSIRMSKVSSVQNKGRKRAFSVFDDSTQPGSLTHYNHQQPHYLAQRRVNAALQYPSPPIISPQQSCQQLHYPPSPSQEQLLLSESSYPQLYLQQPFRQQPSQQPNKRIKIELPRPRKVPLFLQFEALRAVPQNDSRIALRRLCEPHVYGQALKDKQKRLADEEKNLQHRLETAYHTIVQQWKQVANKEDVRVEVRKTLNELFHVVTARFSYTQELREFDKASPSQFYQLIYNLWCKGLGLHDHVVGQAIQELKTFGNQATNPEIKLVWTLEMNLVIKKTYFNEWLSMVASACDPSHTA